MRGREPSFLPPLRPGGVAQWSRAQGALPESLPSTCPHRTAPRSARPRQKELGGPRAPSPCPPRLWPSPPGPSSPPPRTRARSCRGLRPGGRGLPGRWGLAPGGGPGSGETGPARPGSVFPARRARSRSWSRSLAASVPWPSLPAAPRAGGFSCPCCASSSRAPPQSSLRSLSATTTKPTLPSGTGATAVTRTMNFTFATQVSVGEGARGA